MRNFEPSKWKITPGGLATLKDEHIIDIIRRRGKTPHKEEAEKYGLSVSGVRHIRTGHRQKALWREVQEMNDLIWGQKFSEGSVLTDKQIIEIIQSRGETTHRQAAEKYGMSASGVRHIRAGRRRRDLWLEVQEMNELL